MGAGRSRQGAHDEYGKEGQSAHAAHSGDGARMLTPHTTKEGARLPPLCAVHRVEGEGGAVCVWWWESDCLCCGREVAHVAHAMRERGSQAACAVCAGGHTGLPMWQGEPWGVVEGGEGLPTQHEAPDCSSCRVWTPAAQKLDSPELDHWDVRRANT